MTFAGSCPAGDDMATEEKPEPKPKRAYKRVTPDMVERIVGALRVGADMALAAGIVGITRETVRMYGKRHPEAQDRFDEARARADDIIVKTLYDKAKGGDTTAMIFWLKNRRGDEWRDRREIAGDPKAPVVLKWLDDIATESDGGA